MKNYISILFISSLFICNDSFSLSNMSKNNIRLDKIIKDDSLINPLAKFSVKWNDKKFKSCRTVDGINYLNEEEKKVIWVLNMIRLDPQLFLKTILLKPDIANVWKCPNYYTLISDVKKLTPNNTPLLPDSLAFVSARCHAIQSGIKGYLGHDRKITDCKDDFFAECCEYGSFDAFTILMDLLVDKGVNPPGHREACFSPNYLKLGVSIQPHKSIYRVNTVMDFKR